MVLASVEDCHHFQRKKVGGNATKSHDRIYVTLTPGLLCKSFSEKSIASEFCSCWKLGFKYVKVMNKRPQTLAACFICKVVGLCSFKRSLTYQLPSESSIEEVGNLSLDRLHRECH